MILNFTYPAGATPLDPDEARDLIPGTVATQADLNALEQANILDGAGWAMAQKKDLLTDTFLRTLHSKMFGDVWNWAGRYRTSEKNIGVPWGRVPEEVRKLCADAGYWQTHRTYPWDEFGARLHHRLVAIHAFPNGNGRHARLFTDAVMARGGQPLFSWGAEDVAKQGTARTRYIDALRAADKKDFKPLLAFIRS